MSKSIKSLPIRQSEDGKWKVEIRSSKWIKCKNKIDAKIISDAPVLEASWIANNKPINGGIAINFENTADKMEQYNMITVARRFRNRAKLARGEGSQNN